MDNDLLIISTALLERRAGMTAVIHGLTYPSLKLRKNAALSARASGEAERPSEGNSNAAWSSA